MNKADKRYSETYCTKCGSIIQKEGCIICHEKEMAENKKAMVILLRLANDGWHSGQRGAGMVINKTILSYYLSALRTLLLEKIPKHKEQGGKDKDRYFDAFSYNIAIDEVVQIIKEVLK